MKTVCQIDPRGEDGDRMAIGQLIREGIASKDLLLELWREFLPDGDREAQSFHHLCTILKAYCLIYPLKESMMSIPKDRTTVLSESHESTPSDLFLVPCMLPERLDGRKEASHLDWVAFYFDFEKFLPEVIYHRFICQLIAVCQRTNSSQHAPSQLSKIWCRFNNIHDCNWKIELQRGLHRLKISVL